MEFVNHTPFPALAFGGVDQRRQAFHVVVLRQTLTWNNAGELVIAPEQHPLCDADDYFEPGAHGSVRQESDLCQYKPRCDVIVNATAYSPQRAGQPPRRFEVRVAVKRPDTPAPIPPEPRGLNPFMSASQDQWDGWRLAVRQAAEQVSPGQRLIDKTLLVSGPRDFVRRSGLTRTATRLLSPVTLGLLRLRPWRLSTPKPVRSVPMRLEHAFGGQCRIDAGTPEGRRVKARHRLDAKQIEAYPRPGAQPLAHDALQANPIGRGFVRDWYLRAYGMRRIAAPQIEHPQRVVTTRLFVGAMAGKVRDADSWIAGLGVRPKGHPRRATLVGTIDDEFIAGDAALPKDFDFAVWNAAWPDQQVDALRGDEQVVLVNLCTPDTPGATVDGQGNVQLTLTLPGHLPFALIRFEDGAIGELQARLDTLIVEPDLRQVSCVWRATVASQPAVRVMEARMIERSERQRMLQHAVEQDGPIHG